MKWAIVILDGAATGPLEPLGGETALASANLPALHALAVDARMGYAPPATSDLAFDRGAELLAVAGYAREQYAASTATLVAAGRRPFIGPEDAVFCCHLVTITDGIMADATAGGITTAESRELLGALDAELEPEGLRFLPGAGHEHLSLWHGAGPRPRVETTAPEGAFQRRVKSAAPRGRDARRLRRLTERADALLHAHDVNVVRRDLGENPATAIWLWGNGPGPDLPRFRERFGVSAALIAQDPIACGLGRVLGWTLVDPTEPGDESPPSLEAIGATAVAAVATHDVVFVHLPAARTAVLGARPLQTVEALEAADRHVVHPLVEQLRSERHWRMLVFASPATWRVASEFEPGTILAVAGSGIESHRGERFDEEGALAGEVRPDRTCDLMEYLLRR